MIKLSVLIPAYNEGKRIRDNLEYTKKILNSLKIDYEIILINDGSRDNTLKEAKKVKNIKILTYNKNLGKGNALKYGFQNSKGDLVCFLDADLDLDPSLIGSFIKIMNEAKANVVIGSKKHPKSKINYSLKRKILSYTYIQFVKLLFGLRINDTQTGIKLFKRGVLEKVFPKVSIKGYAFDLELLINANKDYKIIEAPVILNPKRNLYEQRLGFRALFPILRDTLLIAYRYYIKKY